ncbi:MAG: hypothetical protein H6621_05115 [Halobacteriovoraceae bacterium]|nr:hypothetical protein [Halobacteriovoraceae bacterium]
MLAFVLLVFSFNGFGKKESSKKNIVYKYKKFEQFDFDKFSVQGDSSSPGDISVNPRFRVKFKNKLPEKKSFNTEVLDSLDMIQ